MEFVIGAIILVTSGAATYLLKRPNTQPGIRWDAGRWVSNQKQVPAKEPEVKQIDMLP